MQTPRRLALAFLAVLAVLGALFALAPPVRARQADDRPPLPPGHAARGGGDLLTFAELDAVLADRYASSHSGQEVLRHLVRCELLEHLARERGIEVTGAELTRRWKELDAELRAAGVEEGIAGKLRESHIDVETFRETLRLAIVHEQLTRGALGLRKGDPVSGEQQEIWIDQEIAARGLEELPPPFADGIAARCGEISVAASLFRERLRIGLATDDVRETAFQILLARLLERRLPPLESGATEDERAQARRARIERAIDAELERRRAETLADPRYGGQTYDTILRAQGVRLENYRQDPAVRVAALSRLIVDLRHGEDGLRDAYERERDFYEGRWGAAIPARWIFRRASARANELVPHTFEEAKAELDALAPALVDEARFAGAAQKKSDDRFTRDKGGEIGWVTRLAPSVPEELRELIFAAAGVGTVPEGGKLVGPLRLPDGIALLWIRPTRPSPPWEQMQERVHHELRKRTIEAALPRETFVTFLDEE